MKINLRLSRALTSTTSVTLEYSNKPPTTSKLLNIITNVYTYIHLYYIYVLLAGQIGIKSEESKINHHM